MIKLYWCITTITNSSLKRILRIWNFKKDQKHHDDLIYYGLLLITNVIIIIN